MKTWLPWLPPHGGGGGARHSGQVAVRATVRGRRTAGRMGGAGGGGLGPPPPSQLKTTARRLVKWLALPNAVSPFLILLLSIGANGVDTSHRTKALHMADAYTHSHTHADTHTPTPRCTHTRTHTHTQTQTQTQMLQRSVLLLTHLPIKNAGPRYNVSECIPSSPAQQRTPHPLSFIIINAKWGLSRNLYFYAGFISFWALRPHSK